MANRKIEVRKFGQYNPEMLAYEVERSGRGYAIESEFGGTEYIFMDNTTLVMAGGKNGAYSVDLEVAEDYLQEALAVVRLLLARKRAGITHNFYHEE